MQAFNNDQQLKENLLVEVIKHRKADQIIKGTYESIKNGQFRACAVGCSLHSYSILTGEEVNTSDHSLYEKFGIPRLLARLEDGIFEGLPETHHKKWPERFFSAIPTGADLSKVWPQFAVWMLTDARWGVLQYAKTERNKKAIQRVADLYAKGGSPSDFKDAYAYAYVADAAAAAAAYAAAYAAYAAYAAADAAAYAAYAAADAADAAAAAYAAADAAAADARQKTRVAQAEYLLKLLKAA